MALVITPNPSSQQFTLRIFTNSTQAIQLRVLNANGTAVYSEKGAPNRVFKFGETFTTGVYLIEVLQGGVVKTVKAVKM